MFNLSSAMEETMDTLLEEATCPHCHKKAPKEDIEDLGACRACDHLIGEAMLDMMEENNF